MKNNKREPIEKVEVLELKIFVDSVNNEFSSELKHRLKNKEMAINIIEEYIRHTKKGEKADGRA